MQGVDSSNVASNNGNRGCKLRSFLSNCFCGCSASDTRPSSSASGTRPSSSASDARPSSSASGTRPSSSASEQFGTRVIQQHPDARPSSRDLDNFGVKVEQLNRPSSRDSTSAAVVGNQCVSSLDDKTNTL